MSFIPVVVNSRTFWEGGKRLLEKGPGLSGRQPGCIYQNTVSITSQIEQSDLNYHKRDK